MYRLTALGLVNALGNGVSSILPKLFAGDQSGLTIDTQSVPEKVIYTAPVDDRYLSQLQGAEKLDSRNSRLLVAAFDQIRSDVARTIEAYGRGRIGVVLGSSTSGIANAEEALSFGKGSAIDGSVGYHYAQQEIGAVNEVVSAVAGVSGPSFTVSTACSSSAKVFASGRNLISAGICDAVIIGGADSLCKLTLNGFSDLGLLSDEPCNPLSKNRKGITIGEGAALFLLEKKDGGVQLLGVGESTDAYHMSTPDPQGLGAIAAMRAALREAALQPEQISYVNLHGTGTLHNDAMEARAVHSVFGSGIRASSTKPLVGHMLGASGATELGFLWLILTQLSDHKVLPPHVWDGEIDDSIPQLHLVREGCVLEEGIGSTYLMSTSFGFGGSNCAVVLGAAR